MRNFVKIRKHLRALVLSACAVIATGTTGTAGEPLTLAGSDLLKGKCAEVIADVAKKDSAGTVSAAAAPLKLEFDGSLMALTKLRKKRADAALLINEDINALPEVRAGLWVALPVAFQTVVVVVNALNVVDSVDIPTLAAIYGIGKSPVRHWRTEWPLPTSGQTLDLNILPVSTRQTFGLVAPLFRSRVLKDLDFRDNIAFRTTDADTISFVRETTNAIGLLGIPPPPAVTTAAAGSNRIKTLAIISPANGAAYLPTSENLYNGDYPLRTTLYLVFEKRNAAKITPLLRTAYSDALTGAFPSAGFIALPQNLRVNFTKKWTTPQ